MEDRVEQNKNFVIAIKSDVGGRLQLWKQAYPIVIEHIQKMILGYKPKKFKEEYQNQFKDRCKNHIFSKNPIGGPSLR